MGRVHGDFGPVFTFDSSERAERQPPQHKMAELGLKKKEIDAINFAFDVYDFKGDGKVDAFYVGDLVRACNLNPTLKTIKEIGGGVAKGEKVSVASLTSTICSTSALCSVMWRVVVGRGSGNVKSNATFSIISIMFVVSSDRGTVFSIRFSSSSIISIGAMLVLTKTDSSRRRSSKLIVVVMAVSSVVFSSKSPLKTLVSCFPVVSSPSTSLEVEMLKPSTPQTGVWRQDSCPCVIIVSCVGSFKHSVVFRKSGFRLAEICSLRLPKLEIEFNEVLSGLIPLS